MIYSVNFDLDNEKTDYKGLYRTLRNNYDQSMRVLDAMWIIETEQSADDIYTALSNFFDNDNLVVFQLQGDYEGWLETKKWNWVDELFAAYREA